jgi:hypothetical protein
MDVAKPLPTIKHKRGGVWEPPPQYSERACACAQCEAGAMRIAANAAAFVAAQLTGK